MFYLVSWVGGCDRFGPCDTRPSTFAHYEFTIHHRSGVKALCPGRVTAGETTTTCVFDYDGGPTYSTFGFVASPSWTQTSLGAWGGVAVTLYDRPGSGIAPLIDSAYHNGFVEWMNATFGAYPYANELRVVTGPTYWSGFEHPGNIVLDDGLDRPMSSLYMRPVSHVLNHEIAHQWAGDETTLADTYDFVWKESMAEYLSYVYEDEHSTFPTEGLTTARAWKALADGAAYFPVPENATRPTLLQYYGEVYGPGPMILFRQLESLSSRQQVIAGIAMVLGNERAISVDDVQAALEASTGLDLDMYFDTWVRGAGAPVWPTFRIEITGTAPSQNVVVTETTPGGVLHGCNFAVGLAGANGEAAKVMITRGVNGVAVATVPTGVTWSVMTTTLDPDAQCLAYLSTTTVTTTRHSPGWNPWRGSLNDH
jgi:aminopeptidase N